MADSFLHGIETLQIDGGTRSVRTVRTSVIGLIGTAPDVDPEEFPLNTPVLLSGPTHAAKLLGGAGYDSGTLLDAVNDVWDQTGAQIIVVRVEADANTMDNIIGEATAGTGIHAFINAEAATGLSPRLLAAPGWTSDIEGEQANPVVEAMIPIAKRLRAIVVADGPNISLTEATTYRRYSSSDRLFLVDPYVTVYENGNTVSRPAAARVAGLIARTDRESGFWFSPSNRVINGITGTDRAIGFALNDPNIEANQLNEKEIATIIRRDGFRLWGNRTTSPDSQWAFLSVRRTADAIYDSVEAAMLWALDKPFSQQLLRDVQGTVDAYLRSLVARGALLGGSVWLDEELNTPEALQAGQLYIDFDIEPPAPIEHLTFRAHRNNGYYSELVAAA